jgi:GNAT superfamily N-acetyltransferase
VDYLIKQYALQQGALEIEYMEEFFNEYPRRKTAAEIMARLSGRAHQILMAEAPFPDDPTGTRLPVSYKVAHELHARETDPKLADLVARLQGCVQFDGPKILYQWIGGTRSDWRGQGHFRALTEEQEAWALAVGFDQILVKTKNKFWEMRSALDALRFEVVKFERNPADNLESKVYLSKRLSRDIVEAHRSKRMVTRVG